MKDVRQMIDAMRGLAKRQEPYVLATVVKVSGSAYRGIGARMLVRADGTFVGTVSGGCLERDVVEKAQEVLADGQPRLLSYDATDDGDIVWGLGLGCKGIIDVWVERIDAGDGLLAKALGRCVLDREPVVLATALGPEAVAGKRLVLWGDGTVEGSLEGSVATAALKAARPLMDGLQRGERHAGRPRRVQREGDVGEIVLEPLPPPLHLIIFGAGYDARPLARLGAEMGWQVTVVDPRPDFLQAEHFPEAKMLQAHAEQLEGRLDWTGPVAVQVMTHNYLRDLALLKFLAGRPTAYLGLLGPRLRAERLLGDLAKEGVAFDGGRLHSPVGLDIGAETAAEIALSIAAEVRAVLAGREGAPLKRRQGPIHERGE